MPRSARPTRYNIAPKPVTTASDIGKYIVQKVDAQTLMVVSAYTVDTRPHITSARCSCPAALFGKNRKNGTPCKHQEMVAAELNNVLPLVKVG